MRKVFLLILIIMICYAVFSLIKPSSPASLKVVYSKLEGFFEVQFLTFQANRGNANAQADLAQLYYDGKGIKRNYAEAVKWARKGTEQNNAHAQNLLGVCYTYGAGVSKDSLEAIKLYRLAAEQGFAKAQRNLGRCYFEGVGIGQNNHEAIKWFDIAFNNGDVYAQYLLGECYLNGSEEVKDVKKGIELIRKSVKTKSEYQEGLQYNLGLFYARGDFGVTNYSEAIHWFRKSVETKNTKEWANAIFNIAYDEKNPILQRLMYQAIAEQGYIDAQNNLGVNLEENKNYSEAFKWYLKAAKQGNGLSQCNLGELYYSGQGVAKDYQEANKWFGLAARQGNSDAQRYLRDMYYEGKGVIQNLEMAYYWALIATACNTDDDLSEWHKSWLESIEKKLSSKQIQAAQSKANKWLKVYNRRKANKLF